jgi:hypothetical protein
MNCPACGADNRAGARYCRECGTQLLEEEAKPIAKVEDTTAEEQAGPVGLLDAASDASQTSSGSQASEEEGQEAAGVPEEEKGSGDEAAETKLPSDAGSSEPEQGSEGGEASIPTVHSEDIAILEAEAAEFDEEDYEPLEEGDDDLLSFWREEAEPMIPVEPDTVLEDRYAVEEALDVQADEILYKALDLWRCWQCGYEENDPEGAFCARCGVLMDHRPEVRMVEVQEADVQPSGDWVVVKRLTHDGRHFLVVVEPEPEPPAEAEIAPVPQSLRLLVGQRSDPGQVRELDEDSMFALTMAPTYESRTGPVLGLYSVADGMGGHTGGEVASRMALQMLVERVLSTVILPEMAGELVLEEDILAYPPEARERYGHHAYHCSHPG